MTTVAPSSAPSSPAVAALRQLSCAVPTKLVRPTFLVALVLLSLHLLVGPPDASLAASSHPASTGSWLTAGPASHRLVWDPQSKTFVHASPAHTAAGVDDAHVRADSERPYSSSSLSSGSSAPSGPPADVVVFSSSAVNSLSLLPLVDALSSSADQDDLPTTVHFFAPPTPFSPAASPSDLSALAPRPVEQALALLQRSLAKLDEDQARDEGRWRPDGWERYKALTRLRKERLKATLGRPGADQEDEDEDERVVRLKGIVLGSCVDDLPLLSPLLYPLATHFPFSLSCFHPSSPAISRAPAAPQLPWAALAPFARSGYLTLLASTLEQAGGLKRALEDQAAEVGGGGWEFVRVAVVDEAEDPRAVARLGRAGSHLPGHPSTTSALTSQLSFVAEAVASRELEATRRAAARAKAKAKAPGAGRTPRALKNVVVVVSDARGQAALVGGFLKDVITELAADPKSWGYQALTPPPSLAASLLKKPRKAFVPLPRPAAPAPGAGAEDGEEDDRFTITLAVAPSWLRSPAMDSAGASKALPVPAELANVVLRVGGGLQQGSKGKGVADQQEAEERAFWQAVIDADLVLDLGGGAGKLLPKLFSAQTHTPLLTIHPPPLSPSCSPPHASHPSPSQPKEPNPNTLHVPLSLTPAAALRVLRRSGADGVDLGQHWKLREQVVGMLLRGVGWVDVGQAGVEDARFSGRWDDVLARPY